MEIIGWRIYYGDGSVADSRNVSWEEASSENVQVLIVFFADTYKIWHDDHWDEENFRDLFHGYDYFWEFGNGQVKDIPGGASVKKGKELPKELWQQIYDRAYHDVRW